MSSAGFSTRGLDGLGRDLRAAGDAITDTQAADQDVASLVGPVARATTPRRTGRTAASVRFGVGPVGPTVEVDARHAIPLHWGAPANHQAAQPWVAQAFTAREVQVLDIYTAHADHIIESL